MKINNVEIINRNINSIDDILSNIHDEKLKEKTEKQINTFIERKSEEIGKEEEIIRTAYINKAKIAFKNHQMVGSAITHIQMMITGMYRALSRRPGVTFDGIILFAKKANFYGINWYERKKAMFENEGTRAKAIEKQFTQKYQDEMTGEWQERKCGECDKEGNPLDTRVMINGKFNHNFGRRLDEINFSNLKPRAGEKPPFVSYKDVASQTIYGLCRRKNTDEWKVFYMSLFNKEQVNPEMVKNEFIEFKANLRANSQETPNEVHLNFSQASTEFTKKIDLNMNVEDILKSKDIRKDKLDFVKISNIEHWHDINQASFDKFVTTMGVVTEINMNSEKMNILTLDELDYNKNYDNDEDIPNPVRVGLPKEFDINFAEGSVVYAIGSTMMSRNENDMGSVIIFTDGVIPLSEYLITEEDLEIINEASEKASEPQNEIPESEDPDDVI